MDLKLCKQPKPYGMFIAGSFLTVLLFYCRCEEWFTGNWKMWL